MKASYNLIWFTLAAFVIAIGGMIKLGRSTLPPAIPIEHEGHPTIGFANAKVHVVAFEEPKCINCKEFTLQIFPKLKKEFIDTNKITYTVIPVSFLSNSMPAAVALLGVYYGDPAYPNDELFFTYLDYLYQHQLDERSDWTTPEKLIEFARLASPAIDTDKLKKSIEMETYRIKIEQNTTYGKTVMHGALSTPTVYVNGIAIDNLTWDRVKEMIDKVLLEEGIF